MKSSTLAACLFVLIGCVLFSQEAKAQNVWGYSSIHYDNTTHYVTATSTTDLDYEVQEYYKARVNCLVTDETGANVVSGYATDNLQSGTISITLQRFNTTAEEFQVTGTHFGIAVLYDYSSGPVRYRDYYDFTSLADFAYNFLSDYGFLGRGPERRTSNSLTEVGKTHSYDQTSPVRVVLSPMFSGHIVAAPENEDYATETAKAGTDLLGPLPMGQGRYDLPNAAYTAPMLMVGQVTPSTAYQDVFTWVRVVKYRLWWIRKSADGSQWIVTQHFKYPVAPYPYGYVDDSDKNGETSDSTPSSTGKIYIYDNSALAPANGGGNVLQVGEFIREEKAFIYTVKFFDQTLMKTSPVGTNNIGQIIIVKKIGNTGVVANDWQGIENSNKPRILDTVIQPQEVRDIVGGNLPIVIDSNTNN